MAEARTTVVVNMFGGPGAGKTTCAWEVAERLKKLGYVTEYVGEYAKELTWDKDSPSATPVERARAAELLDGRPDHQLQIFREQARRVGRLVGQCDFVVTDSPTLLGMLYMRDSDDPAIHRLYEKVCDQIRDDFRSHENFNMVVTRGRGPYEQAGRNQTFAEAREKDRELSGLLEREGVRRYAYSHEAVGQAVENMQVTLRKARGRAWKREQIERLSAARGDGAGREAGEEKGPGEERKVGEEKDPGEGREKGKVGSQGEDRVVGDEKGLGKDLVEGKGKGGLEGRTEGKGHRAGGNPSPDGPVAARPAPEPERPAAPAGPEVARGGWELTDPDVGQYVRRVVGRPRAFEVSETWRSGDDAWHARGVVDLDEVAADELEEVAGAYYDGGTDEVRRTYGAASDQVLAECWFESVTMSESLRAVPEGFDARPWVADARDAAAEPSPAVTSPAVGLEGPGAR